VNADKAEGERFIQALSGHFEVMAIDAAGVRDVSPRGLLGAASQGYQVVVADAAILAAASPYLPVVPGSVPEGEAAAALAAIGEGVCICTLEGSLIWANERFKAFDDQTRARITAVCRRAAAQYEEQILEQEPAGFSFPSQKFDVASPDESRFYEVVVSPVRTPVAQEGMGPGRIDRVAAVIWDVSHSKRVQQKMDAIDRAGAELVRLDAESVRKKHVADRLKVMEEKIVKYSHDLMHFDHLAIRLIDERTGKLELVMASGLPPEAMDVELFAQKEGNGIMGYVAATGRSYLCADIGKDRRYVMGLHGARSSLTVPLRLHDKIIGAFNVESENLAAFTEEDRQFAEIFANHIALALHILDLLVVERAATGETVTGTVQGEIREPLQDIVEHANWLKSAAEKDPTLKEHVDRILSDCAAISEKVKDAAAGPQHIIGAERALAELVVDPHLTGKHVLVADDEPKMRQTIRDVLRGKGCRVTVCSNGQAAIDELESSAKRQTGKFDLVVSDIKMPDKNGYEVFAAARRVGINAGVKGTIPVILMTGFGYDPHHSIVRASQEGLQCVLFKPFQIERLMEEVRKALGIEPKVAAKV
jgi:CheY-like chemotaxis protein/PAS domain-containing protein